MSRSRHSDSDSFEDGGHLSILEAVENLSNIAEMDIDDKLGLIEDHVVVHGASEDEVLEAIQWLEDKSEHQTEKVVEETYRAVLKYVKDFHQKEFNRFYDQKNQEGIKKIMLLVGQATDKLKNFTHLFKGLHVQGIEDTQEYQQLNRFYNERIAIEDQDKVSLIDLSRKERNLEIQRHPQIEEDENAQKSRHFFLDVEKVKADQNYELVYLQRDDGTRYIEPNFFRNIKVACNFGDFVGKRLERNPKEGLENWLDLSLHKASIKILKILKPHLKGFYQEALKYKDMEVVSSVNMALMALMLAANPKNRMNVEPSKSCTAFYQDFQHYLRLALNSFEYQKLRAFPPPSTSVFLTILVDIIHLLSWSYFFHGVDLESLAFVIDDMIEEGRVAVKRKGPTHATAQSFWKVLEEDYLHIQRYLMSYPLGPLFQTLHDLNEGLGEGFDVLSTINMPSEFQNLSIGSSAISLLRLPAPLKQELISKVELAPEFMGLIDAYRESKTDKKHLFINLQDRTSWSEIKRAQLLEKLPQQNDYIKSLDTLSLSKTSDFYHQSGAYEPMNKTKDFFKQLTFNLHSPETGFYFPKWMEEKFFNGFIEKLIRQVHRFFFEGKAELDQRQRQDFIEIMYQLVSLKALELTKASSLSFTSKDALDVSTCQTLTFYAFLRLITDGELSERDRQKMHSQLFTFSILSRSRLPLAKDFLRMVQCLEATQLMMKKHSKGQFFKEFDELFDLNLKEICFNKSSFDQLLSKE